MLEPTWSIPETEGGGAECRDVQHPQPSLKGRLHPQPAPDAMAAWIEHLVLNRNSSISTSKAADSVSRNHLHCSLYLML